MLVLNGLVVEDCLLDDDIDVAPGIGSINPRDDDPPIGLFCFDVVLEVDVPLRNDSFEEEHDGEDATGGLVTPPSNAMASPPDSSEDE